ncbi:MAG: tetratricopeptide repeat protein [Thermaceae bacterium]|nr:tetratricopeptide repeat protein [Thermaceae bacterium]
MRTTREYAPAIELWQGHAELFSSSSPDICDDVAWSLYSLGKYQEAQLAALRGLAQAEVTPVQKFLLLNALGSCQSDLGQFARAEQHYSEMVELGKTTDVPPRYISAGLQNRAMVLMHQGRYPQALLDLEEALKIAGEVGGLTLCQHSDALGPGTNRHG